MPSGNATQVIFLVIIVGAFYLLLIRPQQQQRKKQQDMVSSLEVGAEIMTIGGIYATIVEVGDERLRVRIADGSQLEIAKRAVANVVAAADEDDVDDEDVDDATEDETVESAAVGGGDSTHAETKKPADGAIRDAEDDATDI